jgi:CRP-like cAMP-binding protein
MNSTVDLFAQNPVFSALPQPRHQELIDLAIPRKYQKGELVTHAGDIWPYLFIVITGKLRALKESAEGRSLIVTSFVPGDIFWGLAFFFDEMPMPVTLQAGEASEIFIWSRERMLPFLKSEGELSWELTRLMINRMVRANEILEEMAFQPVAGRLAKLLIDTAQEESRKTINRSLTLDEMAARIGSTREMVCRFLHRFADEGIIDITRTEYSITNPEQLASLAQVAKR